MSTVTIGPLATDPFADVAILPIEEEEMALLGLASGQPTEPPRTTVESTRSTLSTLFCKVLFLLLHKLKKKQSW